MAQMQNVSKKLHTQNKIQSTSEKVSDQQNIQKYQYVILDQLAFMFESSHMLAITKYGQKTCEARDHRQNRSKLNKGVTH